MSSVGDRIKLRRKQLGLSADVLAQRIGVSRSTVFRWEKGDIEKVPGDTLVPIAKALSVTPAFLMGWEELPHDTESSAYPQNLSPLPRMGTVPLIGSIACGTPILAEENIEEYVDLPRHIRADFALTCRGDSMIGADIHDGDVVYVRRQPEVRSGQIAAVLIDDEATLKRVYLQGETVVLQPENPAYPPLIFSGSEATALRIIGLAVAFTHSLV